MHFVYTTRSADGADGRVHIKRSDGPLDLLAAAIHQFNDRFLCGDGHHCLLNPPSWTYSLGGHHRYSLGGALWHLGHWSAGRFYRMPEVSGHEVTPQELDDQYGWKLTEE